MVNVPAATAATAASSASVLPVAVNAKSTSPSLATSACLAVAWAVSTRVLIAEMPLSAACRVCTALPTESSRRLRSFARLDRPDEVKKLIGLSRAELTFLPVARRSWVRLSNCAVFCNESRFERTPFESVISDAIVRSPFPGGAECSRRAPSWDPLAVSPIDQEQRRIIQMLQYRYCSMVSCTAPELIGDYWPRESAVARVVSLFLRARRRPR
jgi:hypothetical protein